MSPTVLCYALSDARFAAIAALCHTRGCAPRRVAPQDHGRPIGALLGFPLPASAGGGGAVLDEMLVLCGFTPDRLDDFLAAFPAQNVPAVALKAVLTPTNVSWTGAALYAELLRERQAAGQ